MPKTSALGKADKRPVTVPANTARLRVTLSAAHTLEQVDRLAGAINELEAM